MTTNGLHAALWAGFWQQSLFQQLEPKNYKFPFL